MTDRRIPDPTLMARLQLSVKGVDWAASLVKPWQYEQPGGEWSAHQHLFHLLGNERVFQERLRRALDEDGPVLVGWDSQAFMREQYTTADDIELLAERFMAARAETYERFKSLTVEQWSRTFTWPRWPRLRRRLAGRKGALARPRPLRRAARLPRGVRAAPGRLTYSLRGPA
jgi:hypothetical protein